MIATEYELNSVNKSHIWVEFLSENSMNIGFRTNYRILYVKTQHIFPYIALQNICF